ncbi:MAG: helix-turn-helix domain-containing protein [Myxococcota bacterium]|nr:helix-turn-helix domain-containing protein [Myxococcota bacterium]
MPRTAPEGRLAELIDVAAGEFTRRGIRLTQMSDVARALGVATGTLYRYVEGKEALLDLCIQRAFSGKPFVREELPVPEPAPGAAAEHLRKRLRAIGGKHEALLSACNAPPPDDPGAEIETLVLELYDFLATNRRTLDFLERIAVERPDLRGVYFHRGRTRLVDRWAGWIERRIDEGVFAPLPDARVTARLVIEGCAWLARHRHGDFDGASIDDAAARQSLVLFCIRALCKETPHDPS